MTLGEWLIEAHDQWMMSEQGQRHLKKKQWMEDAELSKEEWNKKYGIKTN